jgi:hypothetical protein
MVAEVEESWVLFSIGQHKMIFNKRALFWNKESACIYVKGQIVE